METHRRTMNADSEGFVGSHNSAALAPPQSSSALIADEGVTMRKISPPPEVVAAPVLVEDEDQLLQNNSAVYHTMDNRMVPDETVPSSRVFPKQQPSVHQRTEDTAGPTSGQTRLIKPNARLARPIPLKSSQILVPVALATSTEARPVLSSSTANVKTTITEGNQQPPVPLLAQIRRPIPQRAVETFYQQVHECSATDDGDAITAQHIHEAILASHEWHRKWTHQEETGHGYHDGDEDDWFIGPNTEPITNMSTGEWMPSRTAGARNPSPTDSSLRTEDDNGILQQLLRDDNPTNANKRGRQSPQPPAAPTAMRIVRPVALRVTRPEQIQPPESPMWVGTIPNDIQYCSHTEPHLSSPLSSPSTSHRSGVLSPLSLPSVCDEDDAKEDDDESNNLEQLCRRQRRRYEQRSFSSSSVSSTSLVLLRNEVDSDDDVHGPDDVLLQTQETHDVHIIEPDLDMDHPTSSTSFMDEENAQESLLHALAASGGDTTSDTFTQALEALQYHYRCSQSREQSQASNSHSSPSEGMWLTLTKPNFFGQLGTNDQGDPLYTLGRMTFDMFAPTNLVCSLQGNFNSVERVVTQEQRSKILHCVPKSLHDEVESGATVLRTYDIIAAFTIEPPVAAFPDAPNKDVVRPIRGIMTTYGYSLPDPNVPNRQSIWITGGKIEPNNDDADLLAWKRQFGLHPPTRGLGQRAKLLAVKWLMGAEIGEGMNADGSMEYRFHRPLGGHGMAYVDTLYLNDTLRIVRGHRGTMYVFNRLPAN